MEYAAELWFGNTMLKIKLENFGGGEDEEAVIAVAQKIAEKLGGDCYDVTANKE